MAAPPGSGAYGDLVKMTLVAEHADGSVDVAVETYDIHMREGDIVHGGVMMTMLDSAMAASIRRTLEPGQWIASITITTDFLVAAKGGRLVARGWVERRGQTLAFARGELRGEADQVIATASGIWAIRAGRSTVPAAR